MKMMLLLFLFFYTAYCQNINVEQAVERFYTDIKFALGQNKISVNAYVTGEIELGKAFLNLTKKTYEISNFLNIQTVNTGSECPSGSCLMLSIYKDMDIFIAEYSIEQNGKTILRSETAFPSKERDHLMAYAPKDRLPAPMPRESEQKQYAQSKPPKNEMAERFRTTLLILLVICVLYLAGNIDK